MHEARGDDDQLHRGLEHLAETVTEVADHPDGDALLEALHADRRGQRMIPIDHQNACHEIPFKVDFEPRLILNLA
jgi:hypothetical protein